MAPSRRPAVSGAVLLAVALSANLAAPARAFDGKGHKVIEAVAYRTLVEGYRGEPPRPDVLRDLINDGALDAPWCFGRGGDPPSDCRDAPVSNPLLYWPRPEADRPDAFFRRQFVDAGQCFHYMGTLADGLSEVIPGTSVPRALATDAVVRCGDMLDGLLRQIVVEGGPGTRRSGFGLYEMIHAVEDSFSEAHTARAPAGVDYLRVWKPIEKVAGVPTERTSRIPESVFHAWDEHRDKAYVVEGGEPPCEGRTDQPYDVPYTCLSSEGDMARQAVVDLLVVVRDLRLAQLAAPAGTDTRPEASPAWRQYRARWFTPVHPCQGAECAVRQAREVSVGRYAFLGLDTRFNPTAGTFDVVARGALLRYSEELNPFVYALSATLGYRHERDAGDAGLLGLAFDIALPLGFRADLGLTPAEARTVFGGSRDGAELVTRLLRFDYLLGDRFLLSLEAPLEVNWRVPRAEWSFSVGIAYGLSSRRLAGGDTLVRSQEKTERRDEEWVPPPAPYGRLQGRIAALYLISGVSATAPPEVAVEGRSYGLGMIGAEMAWDRDRWGGGYALTPVVSLAVGSRTTSGHSTYLTGTLALGARWYFLGPLGLSAAAVRVEGGPKVKGKGEADGSAGVHGSAGSEYYLLAGSRLGLALRLGIFDLLVESPTIAWTSEPFGSHEILSFRLGFRLK